ncbi:MAG: hypothetical protein ACUVSY_10475, partial [Roseiflexus sp.]
PWRGSALRCVHRMVQNKHHPALSNVDETAFVDNYMHCTTAQETGHCLCVRGFVVGGRVLIL